jgi:hypothetical protein
MPRSPASQADQQLIADAARHGAAVTARQLERWRASGLLAPNIRSYPGRGRGSTSEPPPGAASLVAWLAANARPGRRPGDLALLAFAEGLAVPEDTVRAAFASAVTSIRLPVEAAMPGAAPEDIAAAAVEAGQRFTMVPARIRRIDQDLARRGIDWSWPELARLDPGRSDSPPDSSYWIYILVQVMLSGGAGLDMGTIGSLARTMAPAGGVAPIAGQIEYRWPISPAEERDNAPDDEDLLALLGTGDLRDHARTLAMTTPAAELRDAYQAAAAMTAWADSACTAVEREIADGQPGDAVTEWVTTAFGPARLMMAVALRDQDAGPASTAATAVMLILMRNTLRPMRQLMPEENFDLLKNPLVAPSFLADFLASWPA